MQEAGGEILHSYSKDSECFLFKFTKNQDLIGQIFREYVSTNNNKFPLDFYQNNNNLCWAIGLVINFKTPIIRPIGFIIFSWVGLTSLTIHDIWFPNNTVLIGSFCPKLLKFKFKRRAIESFKHWIETNNIKCSWGIHHSVLKILNKKQTPKIE